MLQKFFLFFLVVLFGSLSQASDVEDYVNNIIESALNKNIRASSYFLSEINRLEDAGADFVHSERMCRLKYLDDLFEIDSSLEQERPIIQKTIDEIDHNIVGHNLINKLWMLLSDYPNRVTNEFVQKNKIDKDDSKFVFNELSNYQKVFFTKKDKTLFNAPTQIRKTGAENWTNVYNYKKYFQINVEVENLDDLLISVLHLFETETVKNHPTDFKKILFHELVHVLDFLNDPLLYRTNNIAFDWNPTFNTWWPSLSEKYDGLKLPQSWDGRITELQAVIGREFDGLNNPNHIANFSELSFSIGEQERYIRMPYANCELAIHQSTSQLFLNNGINQVANFYRFSNNYHGEFILRSFYAKDH